MKWKKFMVKTTTEAEDIIISTLYDLSLIHIYNYGAGEHNRVTHIFYTALVMAVVIMTAVTILCWAVPGWLIGLFTTNPDTIVLGIDALRMISLGFIISAVSVTCQGALEGLGKGTPSLVISLARYLFLIIPLSLIHI